MLLVVEASEEAETVIAIFGISVVEFLKEFEFANTGFMPVKVKIIRKPLENFGGTTYINSRFLMIFTATLSLPLA